MISAKIKLSVIVLFHHGERWIDSCVRSLESQSLNRNLYEIILVDNGGSTPAVKKYQDKDNVTIVYFSENYGFANGNNRTLAHARGEIIILMNQDVVVHHNCLEELLNAFAHYPEAGAISANMLMVSIKDVIDQYSALPETVGHYKLTRLGYAAYKVTKTEKDVVPVDFVSGNALGFRRSILKDIGNYLFDFRLESYAEDLDFSIRLNRTKWQMYVRPMALIYHYRDEAFSGRLSHQLWKLIHVSSNRLMVYYNNFSATKFLRKLPALLVGIPLKVARPDGERRFQTSKFMVAIGFLPIIFFYFGLKRFSKY